MFLKSLNTGSVTISQLCLLEWSDMLKSGSTSDVSLERTAFINHS